MTNPETNPIGYLSEFVQKYNVSTFPKYKECEPTGPDHAREFTCKCIYDGFEVIARASSKKQAKSAASSQMIKLLNRSGYFAKYRVIGENCDIPKSPISILQEHCQKNRLHLPNYFVSNNVGKGFLVECQVGNDKTYGNCVNKKSAKSESAEKMCVLLNLLQRKTLVKEESEDLVEDLRTVNRRLSQSDSVHAFTVSCQVDDIHGGEGSSRKKDAKQLVTVSNLCQFQKGSQIGEMRQQMVQQGPNREVLPEFKENDFYNNYLNEGGYGNYKFLGDNLERLSLNNPVIEIERRSDYSLNEEFGSDIISSISNRPKQQEEQSYKINRTAFEEKRNFQPRRIATSDLLLKWSRKN